MFENKSKLATNDNINKTVDILYITYNRSYYTKKTLPALLKSLSSTSYNLTIVDNNSSDDTIEYLKTINHPRVKNIIYNKKNHGLVKPTKEFWAKSEAEFLGKIDNDILVPMDWIDNLINAHLKIPNSGVLGYCHFTKDDFDKTIVKTKIQNYNGINIRRQPWIGGNYILKKDIILNNKGYKQNRKYFRKRILYGFNIYQDKLSHKGYINGYLANRKKELLLWDHIDDPRHEDFYNNPNYLKNTRNMTYNEFIEFFKKDAKTLLEDYK